MTLDRFALAFGIALLTAAAAAGCSDDPSGGGPDVVDGSFVDGGTTESGSNDGAPERDSGRDAGARDADAGTKDAEGGANDAGPPGRVADLAAVAETHTRIELTWTAPPGDVWAYDVRRSATPITTEAEFLAATPVPGPILLAPGAPQTVTVNPLIPETAYHFAVRVELAEGSFVLSNSASATTKARAKLLVTEVATANTAAEGGDFVELVATKGGSAADLEIHRGYNTTPLYRLGALDVLPGDRVVVHVAALPGPAGFAQEDTTNDRTSSTAAHASPGAFDVYSATSELPILGGAISLKDGSMLLDAVGYSSRAVEMSGGAPSDAMYQALLAWFQISTGQWVFTHPPAAWAGDCPLLFDLVNSSGNEVPACGGDPGHQVAGWSMQRNGVIDTNSAQDFFVAPQTPGE